MIEKTGEFQIRVQGFKGKLALSPQTYDIKELQSLLPFIEDILYPTKKKDRPLITLDIEEGSVKHVFKTGIQAIIGISAILGQVTKESSIDFLELRTAIAIEHIQHLARQNNYVFEIQTSLPDTNRLKITPETQYLRSENIWVDAEFYFYGKLVDAGGKNKANIHLDTKEAGLVKIDITKDFLQNKKENMLYRDFGVRATGRQNIATGEVDNQSLKFVELVDYQPVYDKKYISGLIKKAKKNWQGVDTDKWLHELRGEFEP